MNKINEIILKSGKKKQFIAQNIGVAHTTLSRWCNGVTSPSVDKLQKLADFLNVPVAEFFLAKADINTYRKCKYANNK